MSLLFLCPRSRLNLACREPVCILDRDDRVLMVGVPPPSGTSGDLKGQDGRAWSDSMAGVQAAGERCRAAMDWEGHNNLPSPPTKGKEAGRNRRGDYPSFTTGLTMGCGSKVSFQL